MDIVIDVPAILAVILGEPERDWIVEATSGHGLVGPGSIPWEIGNAFSAMLKRHRLGLDEAMKGWSIFQAIEIRYLGVDFGNALKIAHAGNLYAYDAYFLDCASRHSSPLLTLDRALKRVADKVGVPLLEE